MSRWPILLPLVLTTLPACGSTDDGSSTSSDESNSDEGSGAATGPAAGAGGATASGSTSTSGSGGVGGGVAGGNSGGDPPFGGSSKGTGGPAPVNGTTVQAGNVTYRLIVPGSYSPPAPLLVVFSGTEGGSNMTQNLLQVASATGTNGFIEAVLDGVAYNGDGAAGATVLDDVRAKYDVDNDRTYLLGESAGTTAALELGFHLRQSYFAAYWANDVNASDAPGADAAALGFAPWGQVGPGGDHPDAAQIVAGMMGAGYRLPNPAPYAGPGADQHGDPQQFIAAVSWFPGKSRK